MRFVLWKSTLAVGAVALCLGLRAGASLSDDVTELRASSSSAESTSEPKSEAKPGSKDAASDAGTAKEKASAAQPDVPATKPDAVPRELFSGRVVLLGAALKKRGIKSYPEQHEHAVLETESGELIPIVADWRGRAFFQDDRLRDRRVDLVGMRRPGVPYLQVLAVYLFDEKGTRQYMDYWCDICSIPMYEIKPCDCCQDKIRLRLQPRGLPDYIRQPARPATQPDKAGAQ